MNFFERKEDLKNEKFGAKGETRKREEIRGQIARGQKDD
jgi:hypothetical protein